MKKIDKWNLNFYIPLIFLMIISFFCMFQAKVIKPSYFNYLDKQILWFSVGFIILLVFKKIKIRWLFNYSFYFYLLGIILLFSVLFLGKEINGSRAWFNLKFFNFQPSEFMKIALTLFLASLTQNFKYKKWNEFKYIFCCFFITLIPIILVFLEPDTGAVIFYLLILFSTLILSGIRKRWFIISLFGGIIFSGGFIYLYFFKQDFLIDLIGTSLFYRMDRLVNFKNGGGMQITNALITIGSSNLFGNFLKANLLYVPELPTDFVFTLSISLFGFIGALEILFCYFILDLFFLKIYKSTQDLSYKIFVNCFLSLFIFQHIQNILMNIGLLPIMGIPLPFLSYGGSNMLIYFIFLGIILNIKKTRV